MALQPPPRQATAASDSGRAPTIRGGGGSSPALSSFSFERDLGIDPGSAGTADEDEGIEHGAGAGAGSVLLDLSTEEAAVAFSQA